MILKLYTDGACSGNQNEENIGGWGTILEYGEASKELFGGEINTTNNRMELTAVIEGFKALNRTGLTVHVFSDSSYVSECFRNKWYTAWEKNGWKTSKKTPVENKDLWQELIKLVGMHNVRFFRVKGHVNISKLKKETLEASYDKFCSWNGRDFTIDDFIYITEKNNIADALANKGMDMYR